MLWKGIAAGTAALAIAGAAAVYAQEQRPSLQQRVAPSLQQQRWQPNDEDRRAFQEARLAGLKAGLALTPEQEKNWPAFEQAAREFAKLRADRMNAFRNRQPSADPAERLRRRGTAMSDSGAAMTKLADAIEPLYKSLDEGQKRRFAMLSRFGRRLGMGGPSRDFGGPRHDGMRWRQWGPNRIGDTRSVEPDHVGDRDL